jgi:hypothetical protein
MVETVGPSGGSEGVVADWAEYLREIHEIRDQPEATAELSVRQALVTLLREIAGAGITIFPEVGSEVGQPDLIAKIGPLVVGYGETKPPGTIRQLERVLDTDQLLAYRQLPNLVLTDYLHFLLLRDGVEVGRATLISAADLDAGHLGRATPAAAEEMLKVWLSAEPVLITSPVRLATELARRARWLRDGIRSELRREVAAAARQGGTDGPLRALHNFYRENVMSDMDVEMFADAYAQTVAYGLFVARFHAPGVSFTHQVAMDGIPTSTAFLRSSVRLLLDEATVPATVGWIVDDIVAILHATSDGLIARAAAVRGSADDAVIYFYEHFLDAYDEGERTDRGVFYTYPPLVSYAIRAVDDTLVDAFGIDGLADQRVRLLDPAVGTGTFLVAAAERAISRVIDREGTAMVPATIADHLVPHFFGFELLPAPYAIAHLKLGSFYALAGRPLRDGERVGIYLTNTLAAPLDPVTAFLPTVGALIAETRSADAVKRDVPLLVIIGNPPYSWSSHNREHLADLMNDFSRIDGQPLGERNVRPLDDDYLRFIRWSVWKLLEQQGAPGQGVIGLVTNSSFLSRPVMRGVRHFLLREFDEIRVLDLNCYQRQWFRGLTDEKVFPDVQVGFAITLFIRRPHGTDRPCRVFYRGSRGTVEEKFAYLATASVLDDGWTEVIPQAPGYAFLPRDHHPDYGTWPSLIDLMPERSPGVISHRDPLAVAFTTAELLTKVREFADLAIPDAEVKARYGLTENPRWVLHRRRTSLGGNVDGNRVKRLTYRPFDLRYIYDETNLVGDRRERLRGHLERVEGNIALVTTRSATPEAAYAFVTRAPGTQALLSSRTLGAAVYLPLFVAAATGADDLIPLHEDEQAADLNLQPLWHDRLRTLYGAAFTPENMLGYLYAILTSSVFRDRFAGALEDDFPRIPFTADPTDFELLAAEGSTLVQLHLLEEPRLATPRFEGTGDLVIGEWRYEPESERLWINTTQYLEPVTASVWATAIGGSPVLPQWLRNHVGRQLSHNEARDIARIVASLEAAEARRPDIEGLVEDVLDGELVVFR